MINKNLIFTIIALFCSFLLIFGISLTQNNINKIIRDERLTDTDIVKNAPPIIAFTTVALGSFRGLLADILWARTIDMQDEGKYFEMAQLASWITKLQPRFTGGTTFLAWNMSYNISVLYSEDKDKWRWVQKGLRLIRDEAVVYNPSDPKLYHQLAWIYQHKVGDVMDSSHLYYKQQMALEFMEIMGNEPPDWKKLSNLYQHFDGFDNIFERSYIAPALRNAHFANVESVYDDFIKTKKLKPEFTSLITKDETSDLLALFRTKLLKKKLNLDVSRIFDLNNKYGNIDWRLPESRAIYWAALGVENTRDDAINCQRIVTQSLKHSFTNGKLILGKSGNPKEILLLPNFSLFEAVRDEYIKANSDYDVTTFNTGLKTFDENAILLFYNYGQYSKAEKHYKFLKDKYPDDNRYKHNSTDEFVLKMWIDNIEIGSMKKTYNSIVGLLYKACSDLAVNNNKQAITYFKLAKSVYIKYQTKQKRILKRVGLPPFKKINKNVIDACMQRFNEKMRKTLLNNLGEISL